MMRNTYLAPRSNTGEDEVGFLLRIANASSRDPRGPVSVERPLA